MRFLVFLSAIGLALVTAPVARAIPPPDFIFSITSQAGPAFAVIVFTLSAFFGAARQLLAPYVATIRQKKWLAVPVAVVIVSTGVAGAIGFDHWRQDQAYRDWLGGRPVNLDLDPDFVATNDANLISPPDNSVMDDVLPEDDGAKFIRTYYADISNGRLADAYKVSKQTVPFETFASWYAHTSAVTVDSLQSVGEGVYSLAITLTDAGVDTRYAVTMSLLLTPAGSYQVAASEVRVISDDRIVEGPMKGSTIEASPQTDTDRLFVSNQEFASLQEAGPVFVLDAREDEEYSYGNFPGSTHIRYADLVAGEWIRLPTDQTVYVLCWSGIRGKEVVEFLRSKNIPAQYLEDGASGWVASQGTWDGKINFSDAYPEEVFKIALSKASVEQAVKAGAVLIDSRPEKSFSAWHIPGSYHFPIIYTPTSKIPGILALIPSGVSVITVCDDFVSCFDAKIGGVKLQKAGHPFLGRFVSPLEFKQ